MDAHLPKATEAAANEPDATRWLWIRRYYQLLANGWLLPVGNTWLINLSKLVDAPLFNFEKLAYTVSVATRFLFGCTQSEVTLGITGWEQALGLLNIDVESKTEYDLSQTIGNLMVSVAKATAKILVEDFSGYEE